MKNPLSSLKFVQMDILIFLQKKSIDNLKQKYKGRIVKEWVVFFNHISAMQQK